MFLSGDESSLWRLADGEDSTIVNASLRVRLNGENKITLLDSAIEGSWYLFSQLLHYHTMKFDDSYLHYFYLLFM